MSNKERLSLIREFKEGIEEYEILLEDAIKRNRVDEVASIRRDIQYNKRQIQALKNKKEFVPCPEESLYFSMMGA